MPETGEQPAQSPKAEAPRSRAGIRSSATLLAGIIFVGGIVLIAIVVVERGSTAFMIMGVGFVIVSMLLMLISQSESPQSFIDIDKSKESRADPLQYVLAEIRELRNQKQPSVDYDRLNALITAAQQMREGPNAATTFVAYFRTIERLLEEKASTADQKASILLDKGIAYSRLGIAFYIAAILIWQIVFAFNGFKAEYAYGLGSCSLLFIFIEFLSAWFLKQYRHFVDTSTYMMKLKAIFDRYMLSFLAARDALSEKDVDASSLASILELLKSDIKWPDTYLLKQGDISFAREVVDALAELTRSIKSSAGKSS
jgi:hypothetical protein